jgi:predicted ester cyclase
MTVADNQALVRRFIDEVFLHGNVAALNELVTPDFVSHGLPGSGPEVMQGAIERTSKGLSNASMHIEDSFGEGDRVAIRMTSSATQSGELMGMPPTGKTYTIEEIHIFRVTGGRIAEHWHQMDALAMMRQLGAKPG